MPKPRQEPPEDHQSLEGEVAVVIFQAEDSGFAVVSLQTETDGPVTAAGDLGDVDVGAYLRLHGTWKTHPRFGRQFQAQWAERTAPTTLRGLEKYLGSSNFDGIGADMAKRLVKHFGEDTLQALEAGASELQKVPGIGPKRAAALAAGFAEQRDTHRVMAELRGFGFSSKQARDLYVLWSAGAIEKVRADPYALVGTLRGIGFQTADGIAQAVGILRDSSVRARGVLLHLLREGGREGHCCLPELRVLEELDRLGLSQSSMVEGIQSAIGSGRVKLVRLPGSAPGEEHPHFYLSELHQAEAGLVADIQRLQQPGESALATPEQVLGAMERAAFHPDPSQRQALEMALCQPFSVITGGPGTGKTTTLRLLLEILESSDSREVRLASPTGRAAKRLQEATGREASTLHRLLGFDPSDGGFRHDAEEPLEVDYLVVDEVSMMDIQLASSLLAAVPNGCRVLLVGDADQLPSVGPGAVLRDLVAAEVIPTARLQQIHRQEKGSGISDAAHAILDGRMPDVAQGNQGRGDFFISWSEEPEKAADLVERILAERIPEKYDLDPQRDVLLLAPMYRGPLGVDELNRRLSTRLNPTGEAVPWAEPFRLGDRVMVVRNDYERETFNGDVGKVVAVQDKELVVEIDGYAQSYGPEDLGDLIPAYCVTVHRAQGSEARAVILALGNSHYPMLRRNLLYTAITRGKELVVLVTSRHALRTAIANDQERERFGGLLARLGEAQ